MKKYIIFISILLALYGQKTFGQYVPNTPEAEVFQRFSGYRMNNSTGKPDISIPIYTVDYDGYTIPLALNYNYDGLRPGHNYDLYGLGWNMSGRGKVVRTLRHALDETNNFKVEIANPDVPGDNGTFCSSNRSTCTFIYEDWASDQNDPYNATNYDADIFQVFLPNGNNFQFIIEKDINGNTVPELITNNRTYDISFTLGHSSPVTSDLIQTFEIIDDNGVKYTFGLPVIYYPPGCNTPYYNEWELTKIELPGQTGGIVYKYYDDFYGSIAINNTENSFEGYLKLYAWGTEVDPIFHTTTSAGIAPQYGNINKTNQIYQPLLESIKYGNYSINFEYTSSGKLVSSLLCNLNYQRFSWLETITVFGGTSKIEEYDFGISVYPNLGTSWNVPRKLDSISKKSVDVNEDFEQKYKFSYVSLDCLPTTEGYDHWGYINNRTPGNDDLMGLPDMNIRLTGYTVLDNDINSTQASLDLDPNSESQINEMRIGFCNKEPKEVGGDLIKIEYPTGGYTTFDFEGNWYYNNWEEDVMQGPGLRIKEIANYDKADSLVSKDIYDYNKNNVMYSTVGVGYAPVEPNPLTYMKVKSNSSYPDESSYYLDDTTSIGAFGSLLEYNFKADNFRELLNGRPPIVYPQVNITHWGSGSSKIGKTELYFEYEKEGGSPGELVFFDNDIELGTPNPYAISMTGNMYNKLSKKITYGWENNNYFPVRKDSFTYNDESIYLLESTYMYLSQPECLYVVHQSDMFPYYMGIDNDASYRNIYERRLIEKEVTTYQDNGTLTQIDEYLYDTQGNIREMKTSGSDGCDKRVVYYRGDQSSISSQTTKDIVTGYNLYAVLLGSQTYKTPLTGSTDILVSGDKTEYSEVTLDGADYAKPNTMYTYNVNSSIFEVENEIIYNNTTGDKIVAEQVDSKREPYTIYLWGYNQEYPVAKIVNATLAEVKTALGGSIPDLGSGGLSSSQEDDLRDMSGAMVTTYTYELGKGMTSVTDPSGMTTYYEYDGLGRLVNVKNTNQDLVNSYEYHYKN